MKITDLKKPAQSIMEEVEQRKAEGTVPCAVVVQGLTNQEDANEVALMAGVALNSIGTDGAVFIWRGDTDGGKAEGGKLEKTTEQPGRTSQPISKATAQADDIDECAEEVAKGREAESAMSGDTCDGDLLPPRWTGYEYRDTDMKPEWHTVYDVGRDTKRVDDRYIEQEIHKAYRLTAQAGAALANSEELLPCYSSFGLFLDDFATALLAASDDQGPLAGDLARRARYFYARANNGRGGESRYPNAALMINGISRFCSTLESLKDDGYYSGCWKDAIAEIREAVREPDRYTMHRAAGTLVDLAVDALYADRPVQAEDFVREATALYMFEFDAGESSDYSNIANCHSILGWVKADRNDWSAALFAYEDCLKWYRATQAINPDSSWIYSESVADACYAVAFLSNDQRTCRELLLEAARIYGRGVYDERNASGLVRTYELLAELEEDSGLCDGVEAALYKTKAESVRSRLSKNGVECCHNQQLDVSLNQLLKRTAPVGFWRSSRNF